MLTKSRITLFLSGLLVLAAALALPSSAIAGGWVVVSLDQIPENVTAGQPYLVGMMARQHGQTPWQVDELVVKVWQPDGGGNATFSARPEGQPGHYQVELLFPESGTWKWGVSTGLFPDVQPLPDLEVGGAAAAAGAGPGLKAGIFGLFGPGALIPGILALLAFGAGLVLIARGQKKQYQRLAGLGLLVVCLGLAFAFFSSTKAAAGEPTASSQNALAAGEGQRLFLAKGCIVCHTNDRVLATSAEYGVMAGPDLSEYSAKPDFLSKWLADPQAVKPGSKMPDLGLSSTEIQALVEFLSSD